MSSADAIIATENRLCARNYAPLAIVLAKGEGAHVWDVDGKRYLDFMSAYSAVSLGHGHPRILHALREQSGRVSVISRAFYSDRLAPFLEKLCAVSGFARALPMNTGAEAVETAIKAARRWGYRRKGIAEGRAEIIVAEGNFHGRTTAIVGFSSEPSYRDGFGPFPPGFRRVPFGDFEALAAAVTPETCAVLLEPIQGEGGIVVPPPGFLSRVRALCRQHDILFMLDEIQSGLARTGRWFAFEHEADARPDAVVLGKALGGGVLPVSAFLANDDVMDVFDPGSHGSTFGGNPLACAVGLEALHVIADENLAERSAALGDHMMARLKALNSPAIRDVRGKGLWVGVELDPALADAHRVSVRMAEMGVLARETHGTVLRFAPPLVIARDDIDVALDCFVRALAG